MELIILGTSKLRIRQNYFYNIFSGIGYIAARFPMTPNNSSIYGCQQASDFSSAPSLLFLRKIYDDIIFFRVFRVFLFVNFLYAQPIACLRSYAPNAPGKLPCSTEITDFYAENLCNPVSFIYKKKPGKQISPFSGFLTLLINL